ncbi:EamA family transporter [Candidatus Bathyarchaeota archaeon]|nr:EamA family transporter [Candidatus Bathyarchaeota archaeon]NIU81485.1 EamA family transporter [Candidatus Bathyarchaeota archaeon]NIV67529.1 EamA family transporter [Candidatus Bathyarchaeota archaeon]NIW16510.1 EamA family transporter [Candidatus Bathyarchaeota archaeon]NIW34159.1 EamA family transporter [Candidatus Bathyarchaeota archaeon]
MTTKNLNAIHTILMILLILFWGSSFVVVKIALKEGLTPISVATFRFLIAGTLFLVALLFEKKMEPDYSLLVKKEDLPKLILLAFTGVTIFFTAQYIGIQMASASIAAIFVCLLSPILIAILSARIFNEQITRKQISGIGIAAAGTLLVITEGIIEFQNNREFLFGSLILLSTPVLWTVYSLIGKRVIEKYDPFLIVAYVTMLGGFFLLPLSLAENSLYQIFTMSLYAWLPILFLSVTCSLIGYYIWFYVLKRVGATITSSFLFAEPLITVLFAVAFVGEEASFLVIAGGVLIFLGVYLVTRKGGDR